MARHKPLPQPNPPRVVPPLAGFITSVPDNGPMGFITSVPGGGAARPSGAVGPPLPNPPRRGGGSSGAAGAVGAPGPGVRSGTPDLLQPVGSPSYAVLLVGQGLRAGYPIPVPRLESVGGVPATQRRQHVTQEEIARAGGVPIFYSSWVVEYVLPDDPQGDLPLPVNPALR